jgi:aminoglycoside phosphotransferase family enzyme
MRLMTATVAEAEALSADTVTCNRLATVARYLRSYVINHRQLLDGRARGGRVRENHGDLRADYVCLAPQATEIIGGIEYS